MPKRNLKTGFTLAELLISLVILAEIATFTIPKILYAQQNGQFKAAAKEDIAAIIGIHQIMQMNGSLTTNTTGGDFTPYMNYSSADGAGNWTIDLVPTSTTKACDSNSYACVKMHNGSVIAYRIDAAFGGSNTTNALFFLIDSDGKVTDGTTNGPGKGMSIFVYYNGRITDEGNLLPGTVNSKASYSADTNKVSNWFSW